MKLYKVQATHNDHNDEWENRYDHECIKDENGNFVFIRMFSHDGTSWSEFQTIPTNNILTWEEIS